jgi:hypothetical protein
MKKLIIGIGAVFVSLLLISTATAVPQAYSKPTNDLLNKINVKKTAFEGFLSSDLISNIELGGIIDFIIQLITFIIQIVTKLIQFISDLINLVGLVQTLINAILTLIDLVNQFIQLIMDLFNPETSYTTY